MAQHEAAAQRHRRCAARFGGVAALVVDWDAPTPVPEWAARDVVAHLVEWLPGFLAGGGVTLPARTVDPAADPPAAWAEHSAAVQALFDDGDAQFTHPYVGTHPLAEAIDRFYTADVFMHTWDLARSGGVDPALDADVAAAMLAEMEPLDEMLRASGQYGPRVDVAPDAPAADRLMAFVGRDPDWRRPAG